MKFSRLIPPVPKIIELLSELYTLQLSEKTGVGLNALSKRRQQKCTSKKKS